MNILVVDDISITRALLRHLMEAGHNDVFEAATVQEALTHLHDSEIDLVITDLALPDGDGIAVLEAASKSRRNPQVLLFTASNDEKVISFARAAGFSKVLQKPLCPQRVNQIMAAFTAAKSNSEALKS
jgi:CheY-like chemotaxis protein